MPLQKQTLDIPLGGGLDEKVDPFVLDPPMLGLVENAVFGKTGRPEKRNGFTAHPTTGWAGTLHTVFDHFGQLTAIAKGDSLQRLSEANARWAKPVGINTGNERHPIVPCEVAVSGIQRTTGSILICDVAVTNGVIGYVWLDNGEIFVKVVEADTGVTILGPTELTAAGIAIFFRVRIVAAGNSLIVVAFDGTVEMRAWVCPTGTLPMAFGAAITVSSAAGEPFDVAPGSGVAHLAYSNGGADTVLAILDSTGATTLSTTLAGVGSQDAICITYHSIDARLWLGTAATGANLVGRVINATTHAVLNGPWAAIALTGGANFAATVVEVAANQAFFANEETANAATERRVSGIVRDNTGASVTGIAVAENTKLIGKAFRVNGRTLVPAGYAHETGSTAQPQGLLLTPYPTNIGNHFFGCVARFLVDRLRDTGNTANNTLSSVVAFDSGAGEYGMVAAAIAGALNLSGVDVVTFTLPGSPCRTAQLGGCTYLATGGLLAVYDGEGTYEACPHWYPETPTVVLAGAGTGSINAGTHQWIIVWEWEDAQGNLHRGPPSTASAVMTAGAGDSATITFLDLTVAGRDGQTAKNLRAALYRTAVGGTVYYFVKSEVPAAGANPGLVVLTDNLADATIQAQGTLYTDGGVLPSSPAPPALDVLVTKGRMFVIDAERRDSIRYSKMLGGISELSASLAPEFPTDLELLLPGAEATALAALDDKLIIFSADQVHVVFGDGPTDTGQQDTFSVPQLVSTDQGCISRNSVVACPAGLVFQSRRGLYLLDRGLQVSYIGKAVEDLVAGSTLRAANLIESKNLVAFTFADYVVVWDYFHNAWSKWVWPNQAFQHACIWGTAYTFAKSNGAAYEQDSLYSDAGSYIALKVRTAWIKVAGLQGFMRVWRVHLLGVGAGSHALTVRIGYDYVTSFATSRAFTDTDIGLAVAALGRYQLSVHVPNQKVQAIRFEIEDGAGELGLKTAGPQLSMLSIECGIKKGLRTLVAAASK